jgi:hypothetical protein
MYLCHENNAKTDSVAILQLHLQEFAIPKRISKHVYNNFASVLGLFSRNNNLVE